MLTFLTKLRFTRDRCYVLREPVDDDNGEKEKEDEEQGKSRGSFQE